MNNILVSLRLPKTLVDELKLISEKQHFMDVSEAVRSILRQSYLARKQSLDLEISSLKNEIRTSLDNNRKEKLIEEMKTLLDEITKHE